MTWPPRSADVAPVHQRRGSRAGSRTGRGLLRRRPARSRITNLLPRRQPTPTGATLPATLSARLISPDERNSTRQRAGLQAKPSRALRDLPEPFASMSPASAGIAGSQLYPSSSRHKSKSHAPIATPSSPLAVAPQDRTYPPVSPPPQTEPATASAVLLPVDDTPRR